MRKINRIRISYMSNGAYFTFEGNTPESGGDYGV